MSYSWRGGFEIWVNGDECGGNVICFVLLCFVCCCVLFFVVCCVVLFCCLYEIATLVVRYSVCMNVAYPVGGSSSPFANRVFTAPTFHFVHPVSTIDKTCRAPSTSACVGSVLRAEEDVD